MRDLSKVQISNSFNIARGAEKTSDAPKVIGHIEPCLAQFAILSMVERTYSVGPNGSADCPKGQLKTFRLTCLVLRRFQAELVGVEFGYLSNGGGCGCCGGGRYLFFSRLCGMYCPACQCCRYSHSFTPILRHPRLENAPFTPAWGWRAARR